MAYAPLQAVDFSRGISTMIAGLLLLVVLTR